MDTKLRGSSTPVSLNTQSALCSLRLALCDMIRFHDLEKNTINQPTVELETALPLPIKLVNEIEGTFMARLCHDTVDVVLKNAIYRFTPEFRFRISPDVTNSTRPFKTKVFSADQAYFDLLDQLLKLESCFKIKPPSDMAPGTLRQLLLESTCQRGFLEITSFVPEPSFDEIIVNGPEIFENLQLDQLERINRILIYDIGKNSSIMQSHVPSFATKSQAEGPTSLTNQAQPAESKIHTSLIRIILNYLEQKISGKFAEDIPLNREKVFRSAATKETLSEALKAIDKSLSLIKTDQHRHRESIKALVASFYADNFAELNRLDLSTMVEEFSTTL